MLILGRDQLKDPSLGYARTFVRQLEDCLGTRPRARRQDRRQRRRAQPGRPGRPASARSRPGSGSTPAVAHVEGDDLLPRAAELGFDGALTANAYLGGFGIAAALDGRRRRGRDRPGHRRLAGRRARGRRTTAGRATSYDELAGAVVAGHVIECGTQATGGNFSGFLRRCRRDDRGRSGFPIAEIAADGSSRDHQARRHRRRGHRRHGDRAADVRDPGPATSAPTSPAALDTIELAAGRARTGSGSPACAGAAPPERLKVCVNTLGGFRNSVEFVLTGLDVDAKADLGARPARAELAARRRSTWTLARAATPTPTPRRRASALLRCTVQDPSAEPVGRGVHRAGGRAGAGVVPRVHDDRAARRRPRRTASTAPEYVDRAESSSTRRARRRRDRDRRPTRPARRAVRRRQSTRQPCAVDGRPRRGAARARSSTPAPATRAATPTSASGSRTTATGA